VAAGSVKAIVGRVVDAETGRPLPSAQVLLSAASDSAASSRSALTDPDGRFALGGMAAGAYRLRVASVGYEDAEQVVRLGGSDGAIVNVEVVRRAVPLEGLVVEGRRSTALGGFYVRRARNIGSYVDRAQIERVTTDRSSDLVRQVPGLRVICPGVSARCVLRTTAVATTAGPDKGDCPIQYFVDGSLRVGFELDDLRPDEIEGIEVYAHSASVPARFNIGKNSRCGVVVIWTRGGS
jgi:hypothetical protein